MAFTTGTATDYYDLLTALHTYLLAQGWTVDEWVDGGDTVTLSRLCVRAPGNIGGQQPKMAIELQFDTPTNAYAWAITAYPNYDSGLGFGLQENCSPIAYLCLWANTMDYWFYVNDTRLIVIAKIGTYYMSAYSGFFLPYALPDEYPYPYFVGASYSDKQPYNLANAGMRSFCDPGDGAASYMRREGLDWGLFRNSLKAANADDSYSSYEGPVVWPYRTFPSAPQEDNYYDIAHTLLHMLRPAVGGVMPLWQCQLMDAGDRVLPGILDGVFATGGFNRAPEQIVSVGADDYRLFINVHRNTPKGYFAVLEE